MTARKQVENWALVVAAWIPPLTFLLLGLNYIGIPLVIGFPAAVGAGWAVAFMVDMLRSEVSATSGPPVLTPDVGLYMFASAVLVMWMFDGTPVTADPPQSGFEAHSQYQVVWLAALTVLTATAGLPAVFAAAWRAMRRRTVRPEVNIDG